MYWDFLFVCFYNFLVMLSTFFDLYLHLWLLVFTVWNWPYNWLTIFLYTSHQLSGMSLRVTMFIAGTPIATYLIFVWHVLVCITETFLQNEKLYFALIASSCALRRPLPLNLKIDNLNDFLFYGFVSQF